MSKKSAGLLIYRVREAGIEVLLVHPGGPFWKNKDTAAWSIPKGEFTEEEPLSAAIREVKEEIGLLATGKFLELTPIKQKSGKIVYAWAYESDFDPQTLCSNTFTMEWPPRSGKIIEIPEVDKAAWFSLEEAGIKINAGQILILHEFKLKYKAKD